MKSKTRVVTKKRKKGRVARPSEIGKDTEKFKCSHCGGMLKFLPDGNVCVMCGREAGHHCSNCLYHGKKGVAA